MKASLKLLVLGLLLLAPISAAYAQAPSLSPIPNVALNADGTATVNVVAVDVAGRQITLTHSLPSFGTLNTPTTGIGVVVTTLTLAPSSINVGAYTAEVTATAGGEPSVRLFDITVNPVGSDQPPVVTAPALREVTAGDHLTFTVSSSDPDGNNITIMASGVPPDAMFSPNGSGTGTFNWTTDLGDAGEYDVTFTAMNSLAGAAVTHISVASPPTLAIAPIDDVTVEGGSSVSVAVNASGVPGAMITLTAALPSFAILNPPGTGTGAVNTTITVSPPAGSAGTYHASVTAISLGASFTETFDIIVTGDTGPQNHAPVLTAPAAQTVAVGFTLGFDVAASDADGDHVALIASASPPGSGFVDNGDNTGSFTWTPASGQAGTYVASFTGDDGRGGTGSASTTITVTGNEPENHPPTVSAPLTQQVTEGSNLSFTVAASDQDGDHVALSASTPPGASFLDQGDNTGAFSWTPTSTQSGVYEVVFTGNDGRGGTGTATTTITVAETPPQNHAPTVSAPLTQQVAEDANLAFTVTASDQDGDHVALSASTPPGASFLDQGDNTGAFSWTPTQSGAYEAVFTGNDGRGGTGTAVTTITVTEVDTDALPGKACLVGRFKARSEKTCFRIKPVNGSFDLRDVVLSSITLQFRGESIAALSDRTQIALDCHGHRGGGDRHDDDDDDGDRHGDRDDDDDDGDRHDDGDRRGDDRRHGDGEGRHDAALVSLTGDHPRGHDDDDKDRGKGHDKGRGRGHGDCQDKEKCRVSCDDTGRGHEHHDDDDCDDRRRSGGECDTLGIRACFSTEALLDLFDDASLPCDLIEAEIHATLTSGATVVALFEENRRPHKGDKDKDKGKDKDKDKDDDGDGDDRRAWGKDRNGRMKPICRPNPLNPATELVFTMSREGRVRVTVYDMRGRFVKALLDGFRGIGEQSLMWDGSNAQSQRVASGVYFFRIQAPEGDVVQRVAVVK